MHWMDTNQDFNVFGQDLQRRQDFLIFGEKGIYFWNMWGTISMTAMNLCNEDMTHKIGVGQPRDNLRSMPQSGTSLIAFFFLSKSSIQQLFIIWV